MNLSCKLRLEDMQKFKLLEPKTPQLQSQLQSQNPKFLVTDRLNIRENQIHYESCYPKSIHINY